MVFIKNISAASAFFFILTAVSGCDQARTQLADLIAPQSAEQVLADVNQQIKDKKYADARSKAVALAEKPSEPLRGEFAFSAARASAYLGDTDAAMRYLAMAMSAVNLSPDAVMNDPAFEELQTNVQFLQIITQIQQSPSAGRATSPPASESAVESSAGSTQIRMNNNGIEVRAGDVSVKLPN